eukprot:CAMPEP_0198255130 /NCGR_PEP_ID=MMETSP1447-20131203/5334_1 /TAXON_ID=420782 /ORGANISM="Chaetoceros dichaeta, Strain CCMP1751" /LENGTH=417 /DNA_ID=CAMNT_0043941443 /DNA_START=129 /DNA_END=1382 /DNA_ORIENTATION=-
MSYSIVSISNGGPDNAIDQLKGACNNDIGEMFKFEVPSLMVGTLDSLMNLSDEMNKTDHIIESIVRKIEKTGAELSAASGKKAELTVGGVPSKRYIQQFNWDYAKYPNRRPLKELVSLISSGVSAIDEELKQLGTSYADKTQKLADAKRKKSGSLLTTDLNDILGRDTMRGIKVHDTEHLKTVFVAVPRGSEEDFHANAESLGDDLVGYGGPDWHRDGRDLGQAVSYGSLVDRHQKRGSPVVPGSVKLVKEDTDSFLFTLTILKSQYEAGYYDGDDFQPGTKVDFLDGFEKACRAKRYVVREFEYDPTQAGKSALILEELQVEVDGMKSGLNRWCKTHFGEAFVAWMHIKVIIVFVESVLRYGLPVDFTAALYKVTPGRDIEFVKQLDQRLGEPSNDEEDADDGEEYHDFVLLKFEA